MSKYLKMIKISLQSTFVYKKNYIISSLINLLSIFILIFLWQSIYLYNNSIELYSLPSMVLYLFIVNTIFGIIDTSNISTKVSNETRNGKLSIYLLRPVSHFLSMFAEICGTTIAKTPIILFLNGIIGVFFWLFSNYVGDIGFSISIVSVILTLVFILLSFVWNFIFDYLLGLLGLWFDNPWVVFFVKGKLVALICGLMVPIDLFPELIKNILLKLPFKYYVFFPYQVLLGKVSIYKAGNNLIIFSIWIMALGFLTLLFWNRSIKKFTAVGG